jgi:Fe-S cluster biogenesis protein NfuA
MLEETVEEILESVRPFLIEDGGNIRLHSIDADHGIIYVEFLGNCKDCPLSLMTLRAGVERLILAGLPDIRRIEMIR